MTHRSDPPIILHHYWRSPFSEKVRLVFGLKRLSWLSVEQPRLAPKPLLTALTGGYRRIPVMQIGADIYCDTRIILRELDRRYPSPGLYPTGTAGLAEMVEAFADRFLFADALGLVFGLQGDRFPAELHADRKRFTADRFDAWDPSKMREKLSSLRFHFAERLGWLERLLSDGRSYVLGDAPSAADFAAYHPVWYAGENLDPTEAKLEAYPHLSRWRERVAALGHGEFSVLDPAEAIATARRAADAAAMSDETGDPETGAEVEPMSGPVLRRVSVTPDDWGFDPVEGELLSVDPERITLRCRGGQALAGLGGDKNTERSSLSLRLHFPHVGFVIKDLD